MEKTPKYAYFYVSIPFKCNHLINAFYEEHDDAIDFCYPHFFHGVMTSLNVILYVFGVCCVIAKGFTNFRHINHFIKA